METYKKFVTAIAKIIAFFIATPIAMAMVIYAKFKHRNNPFPKEIIADKNMPTADDGTKAVLLVEDVSFRHEPFVPVSGEDQEYRLGNDTAFTAMHFPETIEESTVISPAALKKVIESLPDSNNIKKLYRTGAISEAEISALLKSVKH